MNNFQRKKFVNLFMPCGNKRSHVLKHTNTQRKGDTNSQVKAAGLFKCV